MEVKDIRKFLNDALYNENIKLKDRKNKINSNYFLAKQDFRVIDNIEDVIDTLEHVINEIDDLQDRIIERNERPIYRKEM